MSNSFDAIFDGKADDPVVVPEPTAAPEPQPEPEAEPQGDPQESAHAEPGTGEPPAPGDGRQVPLSALEAVRKEKTDWKEKAIRLEERIKALEEAPKPAPAQHQEPAAPRELTPQEAIMNERLNMSEIMAREAHPDMDEKLAAFQAAMQKNPALAGELHQQRHPWEFVYQQGARMLAMQEIGDDPAAYRERIKQEVLAELQSQQPEPTQPAAPSPTAALPTSLAAARSSAPRAAPGYTGPRSFDDIFK